MQIIIKARDSKDITYEISNWLRRAADNERAFATVATIGKRRIAESLYAASCIDRLAETIKEMNVEMENEK